RRLPQVPFPFRPFSRPLGSPTAHIELQPVEHAAPLLHGLLWPFLLPFMGQLVAILRGRPLGRRAPRQFQAGEPAAALLPIVAPIAREILVRICTKILREIFTSFLRRSSRKRMSLALMESRTGP